MSSGEIRISRQELVNLYRVAKNTAVQLERLLLKCDLTDDSEERNNAIRISFPKE